MRCLKCGKENDNSARFCVNCGSKLNNPQTPPQGNNPQWNTGAKSSELPMNWHNFIVNVA